MARKMNKNREPLMKFVEFSDGTTAFLTDNRSTHESGRTSVEIQQSNWHRGSPYTSTVELTLRQAMAIVDAFERLRRRRRGW